MPYSQYHTLWGISFGVSVEKALPMIEKMTKSIVKRADLNDSVQLNLEHVQMGSGKAKNIVFFFDKGFEKTRYNSVMITIMDDLLDSNNYRNWLKTAENNFNEQLRLMKNMYGKPTEISCKGAHMEGDDENILTLQTGGYKAMDSIVRFDNVGLSLEMRIYDRYAAGSYRIFFYGPSTDESFYNAPKGSENIISF